MTIKKKDSSQITIFEAIQLAEELSRQSTPVPSGSMDFDTEFKQALAEDVRNAHDDSGKALTRYDIAARMSNFTGQEITKTTLDNWTATSHPHLPSLKEAAAFVHATGGQRRAIEVFTRRAGLFALPGPEALRAEIQRHEEVIRKNKSEKLKKLMYLKEIERT